MEKIEYYKNTPYLKVYRLSSKPSSIFKEYFADENIYYSKESLIYIRNKFRAMKESPKIEDFITKPINIHELDSKSIKVEFPFIEGELMDNYFAKNIIDLKTCTRFFSLLDDRIMSAEDLVFLDLASGKNIILLPKEDNELDFKIIDPDDIQFGNFYSKGMSRLLGWYRKRYNEKAMGMTKCKINSNFYNKNLDIRSIYALFYYVTNRKQPFYPWGFEQDLVKYMEYLNNLNIPNSSMLFQNSIKTLIDGCESIGIKDSLWELVDAGYELKTNKDKGFGISYTLEKEKKFF